MIQKVQNLNVLMHGLPVCRTLRIFNAELNFSDMHDFVFFAAVSWSAWWINYSTNSLSVKSITFPPTQMQVTKLARHLRDETAKTWGGVQFVVNQLFEEMKKKTAQKFTGEHSLNSFMFSLTRNLKKVHALTAITFNVATSKRLRRSGQSWQPQGHLWPTIKSHQRATVENFLTSEAVAPMFNKWRKTGGFPGWKTSNKMLDQCQRKKKDSVRCNVEACLNGTLVNDCSEPICTNLLRVLWVSLAQI